MPKHDNATLEDVAALLRKVVSSLQRATTVIDRLAAKDRKGGVEVSWGDPEDRIIAETDPATVGKVTGNWKTVHSPSWDDRHDWISKIHADVVAERIAADEAEVKRMLKDWPGTLGDPELVMDPDGFLVGLAQPTQIGETPAIVVPAYQISRDTKAGREFLARDSVAAAAERPLSVIPAINDHTMTVEYIDLVKRSSDMGLPIPPAPIFTPEQIEAAKDLWKKTLQNNPWPTPTLHPAPIDDAIQAAVSKEKRHLPASGWAFD